MSEHGSRQPILTPDAERMLDLALQDMREEVVQAASQMSPAPMLKKQISAETMQQTLRLLGVGRFRAKFFGLFPRSRSKRILWALTTGAVLLSGTLLAALLEHGSGVGLGVSAIGFLTGAITFLFSYLIIRGNPEDDRQHVSLKRLELEAQLMREWVEVERLMRESLERAAGVEVSHSPVSSLAPRFLLALNATQEERKTFQELRQLRNAVVHSGSAEIGDEKIEEGVRRARELVGAIRERLG